MNKYQEKLLKLKANRLSTFERLQSGGLFIVFIGLLYITFFAGAWALIMTMGYLEDINPWLPTVAALILGLSTILGCYFLLQQGLEHLTRFFSGLKKNQKPIQIISSANNSDEKPKALIRQWIEKFNAGDAEGLVALYAEDAINDQIVFSQPLQGRDAIKAMFTLEFSRATMVCEEVKIHEAGDWGILEWTDPLGLRGCGFFHIKNNHIVYQRGYFDQLTFFKIQGLDVPEDYLGN
ncbi:nuclear transport factor 2 family protein [Marinicella sp. W31]|uniref:nuclear transport factor 2 family protein n=1 Tax=Marinicella sp. W31 TaxID=3023713 RepID=UPI00375640DF